MRIAIVSYEFPPDTALGGIATYAQQAAALLVQRGHCVEVFAASGKRSGYFEQGQMGVNLIEEMNRSRFAEAVAPVFATRHAISNFDVVESPEYFADGREILRTFPAMPHVVKMHTPNQLLRSSSLCPSLPGWMRHHWSQVRVLAGALRRGKRPPPYDYYQKTKAADLELHRLERDYVKRSSVVTSPSRAMAEWAIQEWNIPRNKIMVVPNPYTPSGELLNIAAAQNRQSVGFFGRLEYRKGVCDLVEAIPSILKAEPAARFRFVGSAVEHPVTGESFETFVSRKLKHIKQSIELAGPVKLTGMPSEYKKVDVCIFPSIWENFPYVCLEAMAAGKAVVGSRAGGMAEMLDQDCGCLIPPKSPKAITLAVTRLLGSEALRLEMGRRSRKRVLERYSVDSIGPQMEQSYAAAIAMNRAKVYN